MGLVCYEIRGLDSDRFVLLYIRQRPRQELPVNIYDGHLSHLYQADFNVRVHYLYDQFSKNQNLL